MSTVSLDATTVVFSGVNTTVAFDEIEGVERREIEAMNDLELYEAFDAQHIINGDEPNMHDEEEEDNSDDELEFIMEWEDRISISSDSSSDEDNEPPPPVQYEGNDDDLPELPMIIPQHMRLCDLFDWNEQSETRDDNWDDFSDLFDWGVQSDMMDDNWDVFGDLFE